MRTYCPRSRGWFSRKIAWNEYSLFQNGYHPECFFRLPSPKPVCLISRRSDGVLVRLDFGLRIGKSWPINLLEQLHSWPFPEWNRYFENRRFIMLSMIARPELPGAEGSRKYTVQINGKPHRNRLNKKIFISAWQTAWDYLIFIIPYWGGV